MSLGRQASESAENRLTTVRVDRTSVLGEAAETPERMTGSFRLATILQIPVGYQDESGFHCGEPCGSQTEYHPGELGSNIFYF
jgi:hypothetical protein